MHHNKSRTPNSKVQQIQNPKSNSKHMLEQFQHLQRQVIQQS